MRGKRQKMESPQCEQRITKVSLAEILRCFEHPISEEQAWALCFQCCRKMEQLARGLCPPLHAVFIKGLGSIFVHADGAASFKVFHKSDVGSVQQSEDKLLEYLGVAIYEALDWGINSQVERELSDPLERLLCLMLKLDDEGTKPAATLQDVFKACEEHLPRPSEAPSHYEMTCRNLFSEYMELQKIVTSIQTSKERLREMDMEDLVGSPPQKKVKHQALPWPSLIHELQNGVRLRKATERPQPPAPPREIVRSPYELLLDDIQHKRYTLRKVIIEQKRRTPDIDVAAPKPHLKPVLERRLKECVPWDKQLMAKLNQPKKLWSAAAGENGSRPKGVAANCTRCPMSAPPGDKPDSVRNAGQQQLPLHRGRSRSLERCLQSKEPDCPFPNKWPSPTIAELIGTRYAMVVLEEQGFVQGGSDAVFPRAKVSMPLRTCVHLPLHFLKLLRVSREEDPATQEQKISELLHELKHWECFGVPVILEPHCLAQPLCCYTGTMAAWLSVDICTQCEQYLLNTASSQQQSIPLRRTSWP